MLYHHDNRDYAVAASEAAKFGRGKLDELIEKGRKTGPKLIETLEAQVIDDYECRASKIKFRPVQQGLQIETPDKQIFGLHRNAMGQMLHDDALPVKMPRAFLDNLLEIKDEWGPELAADNMNKLFYQNPHSRRLRVVDSQLRGFLTPSFAPRDIPMLLEAFGNACERVGALPFEGRTYDTKFHIRAILPMVFEPVPNEVISFYVHFGDSEFGNGATTLTVGMIRLWCTNLAMMENVLRSVHLSGRRNADFDWGPDTIQAMTLAVSKQVRDLTSNVLSPDSVNKHLELIHRANEEKISPNEISAFLKKHCTKAESEGVTSVFNSADTEMLPLGQTRYRFSNALSFYAQSVRDERAEDLQRLAGMAIAA